MAFECDSATHHGLAGVAAYGAVMTFVRGAAVGRISVLDAGIVLDPASCYQLWLWELVNEELSCRHH